MPDISNGWALLGLLAVLVHQMVGQWMARKVDRTAVRSLRALRSELIECRARWDRVEQRLDRLEALMQTFARGVARPPGEETK